ncbi:MAG: hypothetical protein ABJN42_09980 [Roseibium sp.]|uniref:hypothetical protein n=1 Tax=Roseibium sp. TaxID=1936156 RepID=UPI003299A789
MKPVVDWCITKACEAGDPREWDGQGRYYNGPCQLEVAATEGNVVYLRQVAPPHSRRPPDADYVLKDPDDASGLSMGDILKREGVIGTSPKIPGRPDQPY